MTFDNTTTAPWNTPQISLPRLENRRIPRDLRAAEGVIVGALLGGNVIIWCYVLARWLWS